MTRKRYAPLRMCVGCRNRRPKRELVRLVLNPEDRLTVDRWKNLPGRGVYICRCPACLKLAVKKRAFARGFRRRFREDVPEVVSSVFQEEEEWRK